MVKLDPILFEQLFNKNNGMDKTDKVISEVREIFTKGTQMPKSRAKSIIQDIYDKNGVDVKASTTDLRILGLETRDYTIRDPKTLKNVALVRIL